MVPVAWVTSFNGHPVTIYRTYRDVLVPARSMTAKTRRQVGFCFYVPGYMNGGSPEILGTPDEAEAAARTFCLGIGPRKIERDPL